MSASVTLKMAAHSSPIPRSHSPIHFKTHSPPTTPKNNLSNFTNDSGQGENLSNNSTPRLTVQELLVLLNEKAGFVSFNLDHDNFEKSTLELLKLVFPEWFMGDESKHLKLAQCTDGITNKRNLMESLF